MKKRKEYDDDDGRSFADMSGIERPRPFGFAPKRIEDKGEKPMEEEYEGVDFTKDERRSYVFAALGASALIAAVFIVVFAVVIALMFWFLR